MLYSEVSPHNSRKEIDIKLRIENILIQYCDIFRIFVTIPRFNTGIPITLATVSEEQGPGGPLLNPYPDWNTNENQSCNGIISVFRVAVSSFIT